MKKNILSTIVTLVFLSITSCEKDIDLPETETSTSKSLSADGKVRFADDSRLKTFWMRNDHEPWNRGNAEIYAYIIGLDRNREPIFSRVRMPYADHDGEVYYINEKLIDWSKGYASGVVSIIFIEADDPIPTTLSTAIGFESKDWDFSDVSVHRALITISDNFRNVITPDGNYISPEDDIVDIFYQISRYRDYNVVGGSRDNAYITLKRNFN